MKQCWRVRMAPLELLLGALLWAFTSPLFAAPEPESILIVVDGPAPDADVLTDLAHDYAVTLRNHWPLRALDAYCLEVLSDDDSADARIVQRLQSDPRVSHVQTNRTHRVAGMPVKDPYFDLQARTSRGGIAPILRLGSGRNVRIAVLDTGVDVEHPDLVGQIAEAVNFVGGAADLVPAEFHGTAVVGLISSRAGNGIGIHGLAPDAEMLALRACWEPAYGYGLCSTNTLAQALDYAINVRARIINLSLAGPDILLLARLVNRAIELGAVVFGAVGEDEQQSFPASIAGVIAVEQGQVSDIAVPGPRLIIPGRQLLSTVPGGRYDFISGSSFATAHASGVAAVMLEQQPHLRAADLVEWLQRLHGNQAAP